MNNHILQIAEGIKKNRRALWSWHLEYLKRSSPPFYCSVDLRDSGHKIVPVDSNLFPAGFNNICPEDRRTAPSLFRAQIEAIFSQKTDSIASKLLIISESHTQNSYYIENLYYLNQILENAGYETRIGWYGPLPEGADSHVVLKSATDKELIAYPIEIHEGVLSAQGFVPDLILLNNDFSSGYPDLLDSVEQPIVPSHTLGWHTRKKSDHFKYYNQLAKEFAQIIGIDPWMIQIETEEVSPVNFNEDLGVDQVKATVNRVLLKTKQNYLQHQITREPFVFVKNNSGTYGMGIMVAHSADDLNHINRRIRNKMSIGKNRLPIQSVVVQEGIPTATIIDRLAAEPVIYLVGSQLMGGFLRTNTEKGTEENLNSQGMVFKKLCMSDLRASQLDSASEDEQEGEEEPILELVYGSVARLSALATGLELAHQMLPEKDQFIPSKTSDPSQASRV